ncbi:Regulator of chromosome condensation [Tyrophagus putrescentiae]|nr:Regulator of chromosome condensation [Tyrophagus putrescentiae]
MSTRPRRTAAVVASATIKNILTPAKPTPAATPIKATPVKATPVKATPVKATPAKASVAKASAKKEPAAAAATASARKRKTAATAPSTPVPSSRGASSRSKKVAVAAAVIEEEEEEEEDEPMVVDPPAPKPKKAAPTPRATARSRKAAAEEEEEEMVVDATPVKPKKAAAAPAPRSTRGKKAPPAPVLAEKVDEEDEEEEEEEKEEEAPAKKPNKAVAAAAAAPKAPTSRATARSRKAAADLAAAAAPEASAPEAPADDVPAAAAPPPPGPSSSSSVPIQENGDEEEALPAKKEEEEEKKKEETEKDEGEKEEVAMEVEEEEEVVAAAPASTSTTAAVTTEPSTEAAASTSTTTTTTPITTGSKRKASESADEGEAGQVAVPAAAAAATSADLSKEQSSSSVTTTTTTASSAASEAAAPSTVATSTTTKTSSTTSSSSSSSKRLRRSWSSGDLFTLGEPLAGELGPREKTFRERRLKRCEPSRVKLPGGGKARLVACGAYHTLVLSEAGDTLFSFGVNDDGGLGRITSKQAAAENGEKEAEKKNGNAGDADAASSDDDASNSEQEEEDDDDYEEKMCAKVTAGDMHSVALDSEGAVYLWGNLKDDSNKIGLFADDAKEGGDRLPTRVPRRVQLEGDNLASTKIVDIASGSHHVLLLTEAGEVLSLGEGSKGQLGRIEAADLDSIAAKRELFIVPGKVDFSKVAVPAESSSTPAPAPKIRRIFAGQWASFALSESGTLYAWGLNNYFQLGFRTAAPVEMTNGNGNGNAADTSINCPALSLHAELFPAVVPTTTTKTNISMGEVVSVAVGQQHLTVLDSRGRVFTAGSVNYGKLGLGKAVLEKVGTEEAALDTLTPIPEAAFGGDRVEAVVCGDFSAFAITERGRLYGWGQGSAHIGTDVGEDAWEPRLMAGAYVEAREGGEGVRFISGSSGPQYGGWIGVIQEWAEETEKKA